MKFGEVRTVTAIGELRRSFPYAASLLSYVVVERVLKRYLIDNWNDPRLGKATIPPKIEPYGGRRLSALGSLTKRQRLHDVVCQLTLGQVEAMLDLPDNERSAPDRNEAMHSNLYLKEEASLSRERQQCKNQARLATALKHLRRTVGQFAGHTIIETNGALRAQPN